MCPVLDEGEVEQKLQINIDCKNGGFKDTSNLFQVFNFFVCYVVVKIMIFRDCYVKKEIGQTLIWVDSQPYDTQFERDVDKKKNDLFKKSKKNILTFSRLLPVHVEKNSNVLHLTFDPNRSFYNSTQYNISKSR